MLKKLIRKIKRKKYEKATSRAVHILWKQDTKRCPLCNMELELYTFDPMFDGSVTMYQYYCPRWICALNTAEEGHVYDSPNASLLELTHRYIDIRERNWIAKHGYEASETYFTGAGRNGTGL